MREVFIIGSSSTVFGKRTDTTHQVLAAEVFDGVLSDVSMTDGAEITSIWFSNFGMHQFGQGGIRGQVCLTQQINSGALRRNTPIMNIENGCASGSSAFAGACKDVRSGDSDMALVIGLEKLHHADPTVNRFHVLEGGIDQLDRSIWQTYFGAAGKRIGKAFETSPDRSMFMDTYGMQAAWHMQKYGTTRQQLAIAAAKTHNFGADNPRAQYRFHMTPQQVLEDRMVSDPLTRAMCSPIGDGAAALLICSGEYLLTCPPAVQERAVKVKGYGVTSGRYRDFDEPGLTAEAARRAYAMAGVGPEDIDLVEVHDASTFCEIFQAEMLGFCPIGQGGRLHESGETGLGGRIPMNTSGGLVSKGHPIGATGVSMLTELVEQLRGEAGPRQVKGARLALAESGGGIMGFDEACCVVTVLEG
ncbi:thiolase family protein [Hydrogenophaga aromaticivorans]|jgi:acetyl-CoA acetyltransferase|uniref:propanoyl-CoA C-acyltransferase n=1 Tax=Hydrogenophaga aromaticivorans TaxID=2610898 RepID=A0A7Y8KYE1_9BURK|nr:thiolase family protein [Hydrogenophaga aromaticivorans]MBQ0918347.1 thiolase family protein [Hydrogenophaga aromaticivorans]NWF46216.1 thiolase family protein [Hydrogenophaga aromaticivorans]